MKRSLRNVLTAVVLFAGIQFAKSAKLTADDIDPAEQARCNNAVSIGYQYYWAQCQDGGYYGFNQTGWSCDYCGGVYCGATVYGSCFSL